MARDFQVSKVYAAEDQLKTMFDRAVADENPLVDIAGIPLTLPPEAKFASIDSIQAYVDQVLARPAIAEITTAPIRVAPLTSNSSSAYYQAGKLAVPNGRLGWAMRELVVLHEVAHHLSTGALGNWGHGPTFAEAELLLLSEVMGPEVGLAQRILFDEHGVKTAPLKVSA